MTTRSAVVVIDMATDVTRQLRTADQVIAEWTRDPASVA